MQIFMVLLVAAATISDSLAQQHHDSAYVPAVVSSLAGEINVASSGNAVIFPRSKRAHVAGKTPLQTETHTTEIPQYSKMI